MQANVLVNGERRALLCDFGLAKIMDEASHGFTTTDGFKGSIAWGSPEVLKFGRRTVYSDVWAWALLVWEVSRSATVVVYQANEVS